MLGKKFDAVECSGVREEISQAWKDPPVQYKHILSEANDIAPSFSHQRKTKCSDNSAGKGVGSYVETVLLLSCRLVSQVTAFETSAIYVLASSLALAWGKSVDSLGSKTQEQGKNLL